MRVVLRMHMPPPIFSEMQRRHRMPPSSTLVAMAAEPPRFRRLGACLQSQQEYTYVNRVEPSIRGRSCLGKL